jgi:hypothetical protein
LATNHQLAAERIPPTVDDGVWARKASDKKSSVTAEQNDLEAKR